AAPRPLSARRDRSRRADRGRATQVRRVHARVGREVGPAGPGHFTLQSRPRRADNPPAKSTPPRTARRHRMSEGKLRILIVDDEPDLLTVLKFGLEADGFEVIQASDGEQGLALARQY